MKLRTLFILVFYLPPFANAEVTATCLKWTAERKVESAKSKLSEISKALDMFYTDCSSYPERLEDLYVPVKSCRQWGPDPYTATGMIDPWGEKFDYKRSADGQSFILRSLGRDRREGGEDEDMDIS